MFIISPWMPWAMDAMDAMDREKKARLASNIRDFWLPPVIPRRRFEDVTALELLGADKFFSHKGIRMEVEPSNW